MAWNIIWIGMLELFNPICHYIHSHSSMPISALLRKSMGYDFISCSRVKVSRCSIIAICSVMILSILTKSQIYVEIIIKRHICHFLEVFMSSSTRSYTCQDSNPINKLIEHSKEIRGQNGPRRKSWYGELISLECLIKFLILPFQVRNIIPVIVEGLKSKSTLRNANLWQYS